MRKSSESSTTAKRSWTDERPGMARRPDETPFAIGMHALGIMLGIGWWAGLAALSSHQPADANCYGLLGGCILFGLFAWIMDRRQKAGREAFPRLRDQIADFAVTYIASEEYRKNNGDGE